MTSEIKINQEHESVSDNYKVKRPSIFRWISILIVVILIILAGLFVISKVTKWNILGLGQTGSGNWQAVFLSNGQVYFGNLSNENSDTVVLKNIYYLQVTKKLQPADTTADTTATTGAQDELSLVKLGNELHGPEDEMKINRAHILFTEDLKPDGKVAKAIQSYIETGQK